MDAKKFSADTHHTCKTVAELLGVTVQTALNMFRDGRLKTIKGSTRICVVTHAEVLRYLKRRTPRRVGRPTLGELK